MYIYGTSHVHTAQPLAAPHRMAPAQAASSSYSSGIDQLDISPEADFVAQARELPDIREDRVTAFARINRYHVSMIPYFLDKLRRMPDGDGNLLDNTLVLYGSPMGNSNVHNHKRCPLFLAGHAGGRLKGGLHLRAADGTPMANAMLAVAQTLGLEMDKFGDSPAAMDLNAAPSTTL